MCTVSDDSAVAQRSAVERALWAAFVSRAILPGQPVFVDALAYQHHVTVDTLLIVLDAMAARGLVQRSDSHRFVVRELLTKRELAEMFVVRNRLEPWLAEEAAKHRIPDEIGSQLLELASVPASPTLTVLAQRDNEFHGLIARLSGLTFASRAVDSLNAPFHIYRRLDGHSHAVASDNEHELIAEALVDGDVEGSKLAMQRHLSSSSARLLALD